MTTFEIPPPYEAAVRALGWRLDLDIQTIEESDCWALLDGIGQALLIKLFCVSWKQTPVGTLPASHQLIAARLAIPESEFSKYADLLLVDWVRYADGRLYHPLLVESVLRMMEKREANRERQSQFRLRDRKIRSNPGPSPSPSHHPNSNEEKALNGWLATLRQERAQLLRDELHGAYEANHPIGSPVHWLKGVNDKWDASGEVKSNYGKSVRARREAAESADTLRNDGSVSEEKNDEAQVVWRRPVSST